MREKTCCFTGHRQIPPEDRERLAAELEETIIGLIGEGFHFFGAGGALGFDTMAAQAVLRLRERFPQVRLILVLPCPEQTKGWRTEDAALYVLIKTRADKVVYTARAYDRGCMHRRNRHLVDSSAACVCYLKSGTGGTAYTVGYAQSQGLRIIRLGD